MCCGVSLAASGCSLSFPMAGFVDDPIATGSIARTDALLFKALDQEDGRRARAALAVALDPQGNGASVAWSNPQSGAKGSFVATAVPFTEGSHVCRAFRADVEPDPRSAHAVEGSACRGAEGEWTVSDAREVAEAKETRDAKKLRS
jgi:surface antigen